MNEAQVLKDPSFILDKRFEFPGAAAVVEQLVPYYRAAMVPVQETAMVERLEKQVWAELPESLAHEARANLTSLQTSAFTMEAAGNTDSAKNIREVASALASMLDVIQSVQLKVGRAK